MRSRLSPIAGLVLAIGVVAPSAADESRWDEVLSGAVLGVRGAVRDGRFLVAGVSRGGAAERAGIEPGDAITRLAGIQAFDGFESFAEAVASLPAGRSIDVEVLRDGSELRLALAPDHAAFRDLFTILDRMLRSRVVSQERIADVLAEVVTRDATRLRATGTWDRAYDVLNDVVGRLRISHAAVVPPWTRENLFSEEALGEGSFRLGLLLALEEDRFFVFRVLDGSPAERAGLRAGDEVVTINGSSAFESPRRALAGYEAWHRFYVIEVAPQERIALGVRRERDGAVELVELAADQKVGVVPAIRRSIAPFERDGHALARMHLWNFLSTDVPGVVRAALRDGPTAAAEGWLIDLRGRGGRVDVLTELIEILRADPRPKVLLVDRDTRSAKEILAYRLRDEPYVRLVGERTTGAVVPSGMVPLSRGAALIFPGDLRVLRRLMGETTLEGVGVEPHVAVAVSLPYSGGADPIFEEGVAVLLELIRTSPRRQRF